MLETYYYISMPCRGETDPALEITEGVWARCLRHGSERNINISAITQSSKHRANWFLSFLSPFLIGRKFSPERCSYNNPIHRPTPSLPDSERMLNYSHHLAQRLTHHQGELGLHAACHWAGWRNNTDNASSQTYTARGVGCVQKIRCYNQPRLHLKRCN